MTMWIVRALATGLLLSLAALAAERVAGWLGMPRRWVWTVCMAATLALPLVALWAPGTLPAAGPNPEAMAEVAAAAWSLDTAGAGLVGIPRPRSAPVFLWPRVFALEWLAASLLMLAAIVGTCVWLWRVRRGCTTAEVDGSPVLLSSRHGPAVLGLFRPAVVLPTWVLAAPAEERALIVRHEREHVAAHDAWMLFAATLMVAIMPWNVTLWWQHRRLRLAVEVDCDARVLAAGGSRREYGAALLRAAAGATRLSFFAPAWGEPRSQLERRIVAMTTPRPSRPVPRALVVGAASLAAAATACAIADRPEGGGMRITRTAYRIARKGVGVSYIYQGLSIPTKAMGDPTRDMPSRFSVFPVVTDVTPGSAAEAAGLAKGDVVTSVNGTDAHIAPGLFGDQRPGTRYTIHVRRGRADHELHMVMGAWDR